MARLPRSCEVGVHVVVARACVCERSGYCERIGAVQTVRAGCCERSEERRSCGGELRARDAVGDSLNVLRGEVWGL